MPLLASRLRSATALWNGAMPWSDTTKTSRERTALAVDAAALHDALHGAVGGR